jgi:hypothetical protein
VEILRLEDLRVIGALIHSARAASPRYSPDRRWIATIANDAAVRLWDAASREERLAIKRAGMLPYAVHFPADGARIVVSWVEDGMRDVANREVVIYPLDVLGAARAVRFGELTPDERDRFQVGGPDERREHRRRWTGGHIFGAGPGAEE